MGIILGALGGAGAAAQEAGATMMKSDLDTQRQIDVAGAQSNLDLQRQEALEQFKVDSANQQRQAQATRIDTAAGNIAAQRTDAQRGVIMGGVADPSTWTADQQAAVDQSLAADQQSAASDPRVRTQAAIQTGDISPTDAAKLASSSEITQMKMQSLLDRASDRNATMQDVANVRADAMKYGYELRLQAAQEKQANGKIDTATTRMLITSEDANIRASTSQLGMLNTQIANVAPKGRDGKPNPDYDAIKGQMDSLRADIAASKKTKIDLFKSLGIVPDDSGADDTDTPPPPAASRPPLNSFLK